MPTRRYWNDGTSDIFRNTRQNGFPFYKIAGSALTVSATSSNATPFSLGYRMPAEWERHEATWLSWPHELSDWPGKFAPVPWVYAEIARQLSQAERVRVLVENRDTEERARKMLRKSGTHLPAVEFFRVPTNRSWIRDYGPIFVKNPAGKVAATHWRFNGWGKYRNFQKDVAAIKRLKTRLRVRIFHPTHGLRRIVLEGGSIDVNGRGALLTTEECLLSTVQARNPGLSRDALERILHDWLGAKKVLWLRNGIAGDDTHGHVDDLARFVGPSSVVVATEADKSDVNYEALRENLALLRKMKDQNGRRLRVETLPMPAPVYFDGQRLPASYANFYMANELVLVPQFADPHDRTALNTLSRLLPDRRIIGIPCRDLVLGLGTLHCMTQQQPAGIR